MTDEIQNVVNAIHGRLGTIEGKVNLVAWAQREGILAVLREVVAKDPLLGQIYLLLDGKRTQTQIVEELGRLGLTASAMTVSRRMRNIVREYGLADPIGSGAELVLKKDRAVEDVLNLSHHLRRWLEANGQVVPEQVEGRRTRKKAARRRTSPNRSSKDG